MSSTLERQFGRQKIRAKILARISTNMASKLIKFDRHTDDSRKHKFFQDNLLNIKMKRKHIKYKINLLGERDSDSDIESLDGRTGPAGPGRNRTIDEDHCYAHRIYSR